MPTPSEVSSPLSASALVDDSIVHTTCPPEIIRASAFSVATEERSFVDGSGNALEEGTVLATVESTASDARDALDGPRVGDATSLSVEIARDSPFMRGRESEEDTDMDSPSPPNSASDSKEDSTGSPASQTSSVSSSSSTSSSVSHEFSHVRVC